VAKHGLLQAVRRNALAAAGVRQVRRMGRRAHCYKQQHEAVSAWQERNSCDRRPDALSALVLLLAVSRLASRRAS
jgi:hypothetical protein